jgi:N-acetylglucosamine-6-phosphate deacetylase
MLKTLTARTLLTESGPIAYPVIAIEDGVITSIASGPPSDATETLTPGYFDIHVHGAITHDFMTADKAQINLIGRFLAQRGVAYYLATTVTGPVDATLHALARLADAIESGGDEQAAQPVGIHLEGPFVSHARRGVHPSASILEPSVELFERFQQAARGHVRLMTLAPELPHALELTAYATARGVRVSVGHSDATLEQTLAAIAAGASSATHIFNAMRPLHHRDPGILGAVLDRDEVYAEAICDGVHLHPAIVRLWLKAKGERRGILITDGMSATGMPDGTYTLGDFPVEVRDGVCMSGGALAGSTLTMDRAVANVQEFTGATLATAVRLASRNPAEMLGMPALGQITPGAAANFNIFDDAGRQTGSILNGHRVR